MAPIKTILHLTPFFAPNIGGVETHLTDLTSKLDSIGYKNIILTYQPLTGKIKGESYENIEKKISVRRFNWPGFNLFHRLERYPLFNFLYITPYLLIRSYLWILIHHPRINTIHSHGLNAAVIGCILKKLFRISLHIVSIYSSYDNVPFNSLSTKLLVNILNHTDAVLTQSDRSLSQLINLGVRNKLLHRYHHWIDLNRFTPVVKKRSIKLTVLFVGRMIPVKNAFLLARVAAKFPEIDFNFIGTGPDFVKIKNLKLNNIKLFGDVPYSNLHKFYQQADILCLPSAYEEGWGRVIAESISCGTPAIITNFGATTEAADKTVAIFVKPTRFAITTTLKKIIRNPRILENLTKNCRPYALKHYSDKNISYITKHY